MQPSHLTVEPVVDMMSEHSGVLAHRNLSPFVKQAADVARANQENP